MVPVVYIDEISDRADQGMTRPYRCIGDDGHSYFVKVGSSAGWRSLVCEWIAGRLAQLFGLPIAPFVQVVIDEALVDAHRPLGHRDLVAGEAFGSRRVEHVRDVEPMLLPHCSTGFRRDLVAFDWWIHNADRTLGDLAGNPNLLWASGPPACPVVIDHNLAFDTDFDAQQFVETHVFRDDFEQIRADMLLRADYQQRFTQLLPQFTSIWAELPHNWIHTEDGDARVRPSDFVAVLRRSEQDNFWHVPPRPPQAIAQP
jgi:hypothetical protein